MALLDFLKKKEEIEKAKKADKKAEPSVAKEKKVADKTASVAPATVELRPGKFSYDVIKKPHVSEKAGLLSEKNQYIFKVDPKVNKTEVKKAIEGMYRVNVTSVNMIKIPAKKRRLGKTQGFKKGYKKAIVTVKQGQKIEII